MLFKNCNAGGLQSPATFQGAPESNVWRIQGVALSLHPPVASPPKVKPGAIFDYVQYGTVLNVPNEIQCGLPINFVGRCDSWKISLSLLCRRIAGQQRRNNVFHLIWYILIGLIAGVLAKSVMNVHLTLFWTIAIGVIGSILGGAVTHMFSRPANNNYHPAGLLFFHSGRNPATFCLL